MAPGEEGITASPGNGLGRRDLELNLCSLFACEPLPHSVVSDGGLFDD